MVHSVESPLAIVFDRQETREGESGDAALIMMELELGPKLATITAVPVIVVAVL
jgi:hypothetical protein